MPESKNQKEHHDCIQPHHTHKKKRTAETRSVSSTHLHSQRHSNFLDFCFRMTIRDTNKNGIPSYQTQDVLIDPIIYGEEDPLLKANHEEDFAEPVFRDVAWALLFLVHLAVMIYLGVAYGSFGVEHDKQWNSADLKEELEASIDDDKVLHQMETFAEAAEEYVQVFPQRIFIYVVIPCALLASVVSYAGTAFVIPSCAKICVQTALIGSIGWTILLTVFISVASQSWFVYLMSAGMIAVMIYYVTIVWRLIPFAAVNLEVSLKGISANWGMYILAFLFSVAGFVWTIFWIYVTIGVLGHETLTYNEEHTKNAGSSNENDDVGPQGLTIFLLLVSLYWTSTVLLVSTHKLKKKLQELCSKARSPSHPTFPFCFFRILCKLQWLV